MIKYKIFILVAFYLFFFSYFKVYANVCDFPLFGKIIYLDAGHGGVDAGAEANNIREKDINLVLVKKLQEVLVSKGAIVYLTRDGDYDLSKTSINRKRNDLANRAKLINDSDADLYISIHLNSTTDSRWRGLQIFYNNVNTENKFLANAVNDDIKKNLSNVREVKKENSYYMYKRINIPGILIEAGFISNSSDNYILRDSNYQDKLVNNIVLGIISYYQTK